MVGEDDGDQFWAGTGSDILWGGANGNDLGGLGTDIANYSLVSARISITFNGFDGVYTLAVVDGEGGIDILHSIEKIIGTSLADRFVYGGDIPNGLSLTIDAAGGLDEFVDLRSSTTALTLSNTATGGTITQAGSTGVITLLNFHTQILGSAFDDTIADSSTGRKTIDGGDGADVITVGGDARAMLRGGRGDDVLTGGDGGDVLIGGGGDDQLFGGAGTDLLISDSGDSVSGEEILDGGEGSDLLIARSFRDNLILHGGAGNDLIDTRASGNVILHFGADDGHDLIEGDALVGEPTFGGLFGNSQLGLGSIVFAGLDLADVTIYWDATITDEEYHPGSDRWHYIGVGDLAIVVNATGASILFKNVVNELITFGNHDPFNPGTYFATFGLPDLIFEDGQFGPGESGTNIPIVRASVAQYDVARADYDAGVEDSAVDDVGTSGDDELSGGIGDDSLAGGDGDDGFHVSGGDDLFDGGAGSDTLYLFGARLDYVVSRDPVSGDITLADQAGADGAITVTSVEKIYFATDDEAFEPGELTGYYGTAGNDVIAGSARDSRIYGLAGEDDLSGGDGADLIDGGEDDDALYGEAGDDVLIGGAGDNSLDGGDGSDRADYSAAAGAVVVNLGTGTAADNGLGGTDSLAGIENLTGSAFADTLTGDAGANSLDGGGGTDALAGGDGDDTYFVDAGDVVTEDADSGIDTIVTSLTSYALGANVETLVYAGLAGFAGTGNALDNRIRGDQGDDDLSGGDGDDLFDATGGLDLIDGGNGIDTIRFTGSLYSLSYSRDGFGVATVVVPAGMEGTMQLTGIEYYYFESEDQSFTIDDLLLLSVTGTEGNDALLEGNWLDNRIYGLGGNDVLWGKAGYDTLDGGDGDDVAHYAGSSDDFRIFRNETGDVGVGDLVGSDGWDTLIGVESLFFAGDNVTVDVIDLPMLGTSGNDSLAGSSRPDLLIGLDGDDSLDGLGGGDDLLGGMGNDLYLLGAGDDSASDDGGDDAYVYALGDGDDGIFDGAGIDYLAFGTGIAPEDVTVTVFEDESYVLSFAGASGSVTLWAAVWEDYAIEEVRFDDETVWTAQDLHDLAFGPPPMSAFRGDDDLSQGRAGGDLFALNGQIDYGMHCPIA